MDSFASGFVVGLVVGMGLVAIGVMLIGIPLANRLAQAQPQTQMPVAKVVVQNEETAEIVRDNNGRVQGYIVHRRVE